MLLAETKVYGLILGPSWLRQSLVADFVSWGYKKNPYDKCLLALPPKDPQLNQNSGAVLIEVDDILEGGDEYHQACMNKNYDKYLCGKPKNLQSLGDEGTLISGIRVMQRRDFSFSWHMNDYIRDTLRPIDVPRGCLAQNPVLGDTHVPKILTGNGQI